MRWKNVILMEKIREIFSAILFVAQKNDRDIANEWGSVWRVAAARRIVQTVPQTASQRWSGSETSFLKFYDTESATNKSVHKDNVLLPPISLIDNIAKGTTDPSVECYCQITALRYRKFLCQFDQNLAKRSCQDSWSWPYFSIKILTKIQLQNIQKIVKVDEN